MTSQRAILVSLLILSSLNMLFSGELQSFLFLFFAWLRWCRTSTEVQHEKQGSETDALFIQCTTHQPLSFMPRVIKPLEKSAVFHVESLCSNNCIALHDPQVNLCRPTLIGWWLSLTQTSPILCPCPWTEDAGRRWWTSCQRPSPPEDHCTGQITASP